ncbi:MAG: translation initiation factor [Candidatus Diapherotrites archaeon]|uniref:Protein translation factor SUI1 homolog n=1 Tax=Candidatus Iainarchaeum sp. TaxID=3101447 RepID=A0A938YTI6_9ARCH|nr:translation initiation factor [Candidatus Diapherotrites archaeon]
MEEICQKCGLPKNLCVCQQIAKEQQKIRIRVDSRRFGKVVTVVSGLGKDVDLEELTKQLKRKLACGGTLKNSEIILQGSHKNKVKQMLLEQGFKEELIDA